MTPRTTKTERTIDGKELAVVARELYGKDRITDAQVRNRITEGVYKQFGYKSPTEMEQAVYNTIIAAAEIIIQVISLEGDWPVNLILPDPGDQRACVAFYNALMDLQDRYTVFLLHAIREADKDLPNPTGGQKEKPSVNERTSGSASIAAD